MEPYDQLMCTIQNCMPNLGGTIWNGMPNLGGTIWNGNSNLDMTLNKPHTSLLFQI